jgi:hypothetical protein
MSKKKFKKKVKIVPTEPHGAQTRAPGKMAAAPERAPFSDGGATSSLCRNQEKGSGERGTGMLGVSQESDASGYDGVAPLSDCQTPARKPLPRVGVPHTGMCRLLRI